MMAMNWRALSLNRLAHMGELKRSGRWRHYFATEDAFEEFFRKASADAEKWKQLADRQRSKQPERRPAQLGTAFRHGCRLMPDWMVTPA